MPVTYNHNVEPVFSSEEHQRLFYILLEDFLSERTEASLLPDNVSAMQGLEKIAKEPKLGESVSAGRLQLSCRVFSEWLTERGAVDTWCSNLETNLVLELSRREIIKFSANMSKHHFGHLSYVIAEINKKAPGYSKYDFIPLLKNIYHTLNDNILSYHTAHIVEMLTNMRWGIHEYLKPEYSRAFRRQNSSIYTYDIPEHIKSDLATSCYWELMESVRSGPHIKQFTVSEILKQRY